MKKIIYIFTVLCFLFLIAGCKKEYTITFKYSNGELINEVKAKKDSKVSLPILETDEGYYIEWSVKDTSYIEVKSDLEIIASIKEYQKDVKYYIDGVLVFGCVCNYSEVIIEPVIPNFYKDATFIENKSFIDDVYYYTYVLQYSKKEVNVLFVDEDDNLIESKNLEYGTSCLSYPEASEGYYYEWDKSLTELQNLTDNIKVVGTLREASKNVKYIIEEETILEYSGKYSDVVETPEIPSNYKNAEFVLTLKVIDNVYYYEYNLEYDYKNIKVRFVDSEGNAILTYTLQSGSDFNRKYPTTQEGYYYVWDKESSELVDLVDDVIITGTLHEYNKHVKYYIDGEVIFEQSGKYSDVIEDPDFPEGTTNQKWVLSSKELIEDTFEFTYELDYDLSGKGRISYFDGDKELDLYPKTYDIGKITELPTLEKEGYAFVGWFVSDISLYRYEDINENVTGDIMLYARFINTEKETPLVLPETDYHFTSVTKKLHSSGNTYVYQPVFPSNAPSSSATAYDWSTSDSNIATVSQWSTITAKAAGYCILTATLKTDQSIVVNCVINSSVDGITYATVEEANTVTIFTVTFKDKDGNVIEEQKVNKGGAVTPPTPPKYDGLAFNGWDKNIYNITSDTVITATYIEGTNNYVGKRIAIIGDSISTYEGYVPEGYDCFYPYPTASVSDVNLTWWKQAANKLGAGIFVNNSYSGTCVSTGTYGTNTDLRLSQTVFGDQKPDVILILMGANDCASQYVTANSFESQYKVMIDKLKALCPDSEIVLCTLPKSKYYSTSNQTDYNNVIKKYSTEYGLKLVDLSTVDISDELVDSAHPDVGGMVLMANKVVSEMLK